MRKDKFPYYTTARKAASFPPTPSNGRSHRLNLFLVLTSMFRSLHTTVSSYIRFLRQERHLQTPRFFFFAFHHPFPSIVGFAPVFLSERMIAIKSASPSGSSRKPTCPYRFLRDSIPNTMTTYSAKRLTLTYGKFHSSISTMDVDRS